MIISQGRSAGDEKDKRPHHRIPGPHHRRGARRDLGDQGHRAGGQAECGCGREEGQGESSSWHSLTFNHELVDWWRNWRGRAVLWHLWKQPGWQGIHNVNIKYGFEAVFFRWEAFSQRMRTSTRKHNKLSTFNQQDQNLVDTSISSPIPPYVSLVKQFADPLQRNNKLQNYLFKIKFPAVRIQTSILLPIINLWEFLKYLVPVVQVHKSRRQTRHFHEILKSFCLLAEPPTCSKSGLK